MIADRELLGDDWKCVRLPTEKLAQPPDEERILDGRLCGCLLEKALECCTELTGRNPTGTVITLHGTSFSWAN